MYLGLLSALRTNVNWNIKTRKHYTSRCQFDEKPGHMMGCPNIVKCECNALHCQGPPAASQTASGAWHFCSVFLPLHTACLSLGSVMLPVIALSWCDLLPTYTVTATVCSVCAMLALCRLSTAMTRAMTLSTMGLSNHLVNHGTES